MGRIRVFPVRSVIISVSFDVPASMAVRGRVIMDRPYFGLKSNLFFDVISLNLSASCRDLPPNSSSTLMIDEVMIRGISSSFDRGDSRKYG